MGILMIIAGVILFLWGGYWVLEDPTVKSLFVTLLGFLLLGMGIFVLSGSWFFLVIWISIPLSRVAYVLIEDRKKKKRKLIPLSPKAKIKVLKESIKKNYINNSFRLFSKYGVLGIYIDNINNEKKEVSYLSKEERDLLERINKARTEKDIDEIVEELKKELKNKEYRRKLIKAPWKREDEALEAEEIEEERIEREKEREEKAAREREAKRILSEKQERIKKWMDESEKT